MPTSWVLHVDLDEFLAAVEVQRNPSLAGRPVVVGGRGDPTERGVVSTASYAAREYGVHSGMPLRTAAKRCPGAVFLPVDRPVYEQVSVQVMSTLRSFEVPVEVLGWDEAFVAVPVQGTGSPPVAFAAELQAAVLERTGLHSSVGIGDTKVRAKIATDLGKPRGTFVLTEQNWFAVMGDRPTDALWGIGAKTAKRLAGLGIHTVRELAETPAQPLAEAIGPRMGPWYRRLGRGADTSPVDPTPYVPHGHGRETTFQQNLLDWGDVVEEAQRLAAQVLNDIRADGRRAVRVGVKLRYAPFETRTRSLTLSEPTFDEQTLVEAALSLLERFDSGRAVRLLGVRLEMEPPGAGSRC